MSWTVHLVEGRDGQRMQRAQAAALIAVTRWLARNGHTTGEPEGGADNPTRPAPATGPVGTDAAPASGPRPAQAA